MYSIRSKLTKFPALIALFLSAAACVGTPNPGESTEQAILPSQLVSPVFTILDIEGKPVGEIDDLLGEAALARVEGKGEFRRYDFANCGLLVVLYPDENNVLAVNHVEAAARGTDETKPNLTECLAAGL